MLFSLSSPQSRLLVPHRSSGEVGKNVSSGALLPYVHDNGNSIGKAKNPIQSLVQGVSKMNDDLAFSPGKSKSQLMVVGGGIAGMEAALTAASMGLQVYLVEKESAIGGVMAQLDKTFPTNECSM